MAITYDLILSNRSIKKPFTGLQLSIIGLFGVLPDLVDPHLYLHDRYNSWSHTVWFILGIALVLLSIRIMKIVKTNSIAVMLLLAVVLHIICDGISGGVKILYPNDTVYGKYYIESKYWLVFDVSLFVVLMMQLTYARYKLKGQPNRSPTASS